mmetsp:Transcript_80586/g.218222  ORF Transcript_80586/g.218222 Transcript_80586/m.218222 type:complete len:248 (-) Transcript_80586:675-1418(-)
MAAALTRVDLSVNMLLNVSVKAAPSSPMSLSAPSAAARTFGLTSESSADTLAATSASGADAVSFPQAVAAAAFTGALGSSSSAATSSTGPVPRSPSAQAAAILASGLSLPSNLLISPAYVSALSDASADAAAHAGINIAAGCLLSTPAAQWARCPKSSETSNNKLATSAALSLAGPPIPPRASAAAALAPGSGSPSSAATLGTRAAAFSLSVPNRVTAAARTLASLSRRAAQTASRCCGTASSNLPK